MRNSSRYKWRSREINESHAGRSRSPGELRISIVGKKPRSLTFAQLESVLMMIANATAPHGGRCLRRQTLRVMTSWDSSSTPSSDLARTALMTRYERQRRNLPYA